MWKKFKSKLKKVEPERFELSTPALQGQCSSQLSYDPNCCLLKPTHAWLEVFRTLSRIYYALVSYNSKFLTLLFFFVSHEGVEPSIAT